MKKIFGLAAVIAMVAAVNVRMSSNNNEGLTALQLENIEYLAEAEGGPSSDCPLTDGCPCWKDGVCYGRFSCSDN